MVALWARLGYRKVTVLSVVQHSVSPGALTFYEASTFHKREWNRKDTTSPCAIMRWSSQLAANSGPVGPLLPRFLISKVRMLPECYLWEYLRTAMRENYVISKSLCTCVQSTEASKVHWPRHACSKFPWLINCHSYNSRSSHQTVHQWRG